MTVTDRLPLVIEALRTSVFNQNDASRAMLAALEHRTVFSQLCCSLFKLTGALAGLSSSRYFHWFSEQTGMPLRSYKKWPQLLLGFELSQRMTLTDAAMLQVFPSRLIFAEPLLRLLLCNPQLSDVVCHQSSSFVQFVDAGF